MRDIISLANVGGLVLIAVFFWFLLKGVREDTVKMQDFIQKHMSNDQEHLSKFTVAMTEVVANLKRIAERVEMVSIESKERAKEHEMLAAERQQIIIHSIEKESEFIRGSK